MRGVTFLKSLRRRPLFPVLALAYALLAQTILGNAMASAHAFALAQHDALGLGMLCPEGAPADSGKSAPEPQQAPGGNDCMACKIACAAAVGMPVLPQPEMVALFTIYPNASIVPSAHDAAPLVRAALFPSDLAAQAPPAALS